MADPTQGFKEVQPFTPTHLPFLNDEDGRLHADFLIAYGCLGNDADAHRAVLRAWNQLGTTMAAQAESRRSRYVAEFPRASYKPFIEEDLTRRRLLLGAIRAIQMNNETVEGKIDDTRNILWLSLEIGLEVLHHTPFNAAVGMGRVLANYSGKQTLQLYDRATRDRPEQILKSSTEICRIEDGFAEVLIERFKERIKCSPRSNKRFLRVKPTPLQLDELRYWLPYFLPNVSDLTKGVVVPIKSEGMNKMKLVNDLLAIDRFNEIARKEKLLPFEELASIPLITSSDSTDTEPSPGDGAPKRSRRSGAPVCDVKGVKRALEEARLKRMSIRPVSLAIYVDDVLRGELQSADDSCALDLKRSARLLVIAARDRDGEEVPLATHVLVHDCAKSEMLEFNAAGMGIMHCALRFKDDGRIEAVFTFVEKVDTAIAALIENNVMSHTTHAYALKILGRIACMPHIVPGILDETACRDESPRPCTSLTSFLEGAASPMPWNSGTLDELAHQLKSAIMLGQPEASDNVQALTEAQMLLRWLWTEGYEAHSGNDNRQITEEHANCFIKGMRAAIDQMGAHGGSFPADRHGTGEVRHLGMENQTVGIGLNVPRDNSGRHKDTGNHSHKVKPNHA